MNENSILKCFLYFSDRMATLESNLEQLGRTITQMDDRGRRIEETMTMLLRSLANPSQPLRIENLELER